MNACSRILLGASMALLAASSVAEGGSVWAKGRNRTRHLYTDDSARNVGDSVTIVIEENPKIENETTRKMDKSSSRSGKASGTVDLGNMVNWLKGRIWNLPNVDLSSAAANKFDGKAEFDDEKKVTDKITVTVEDVLPNGNLLVLGKRERGIAGDKQTVQVSGIVRPSDVGFNNEVSSKKVADFKMVYKGKGQESHFTKPGWLARILNWLNPE
ncbi:MAG TPA: flagellar basal body L-ring protein FlgH [Phycisphaerae bacterium]|nr:flagellar basal body L-ring protein FlgH [Phycisphaerae bacterium]